MNELKFIEYLRKNIKTKADVVVGIGDDTAVIRYTKNKYLLFASDMIIEGVHFTKGTNPYAIGWKAAAVNISDIAAMGGVPKYIVISVGVPKKNRERTLLGITKGAKDICKRFGVSIVGGDTNSSNKTIVVDVAIIGYVSKKHLLTRSGARVSDLVFVTGSLGEGKFKHLDFIPRIRESQVLVNNFKINSMIDISDGLFIDLTRVCTSSGVGACIYKSQIPVSPKAPDFRTAVGYGEDFELVFTLSTKQARRLLIYSVKEGFAVKLIGKIGHKKNGIKMISEQGSVEKIKPLGYTHF